MMSEEEGRVLITTHDLERAGPLREAFEGAGYTVELVTPDEDISGGAPISLLVVTGQVDSPSAHALTTQARVLSQAPAFALAEDDGAVARVGADYVEAFGADTRADDVLFVARSLIERKRLQVLMGIVGETDAMKEVLERVVQFAPVGSTVLITGESGTGKELVARGIHYLSPRRHKPFIAVNVAALSETLLESELFGHEKGAFTGAIDSRRGLFELAHRGTIFLDEIGEMPRATQTALLRVLEQREFHRVGGESVVKVDIRVVTATNQDLRQLVATGQFRKDLYYRLNVLHIELPPLRRRREDIPLLVETFIADASERHDRSFAGISPAAMKILQEHHWPGNIRELQNLVESMVVLAPGREVMPADIPAEVRGGDRTGGALVPIAPGPTTSSLVPSQPGLRPELEFIFRTLVDLRLDVDDLRQEFDVYRGSSSSRTGVVERYPVDIGSVEVGVRPASGEADPSWSAVERLEPSEAREAGFAPESRPDPDGGESGAVVFRSGMTMEDLEREAIVAALAEVRGNRRKAAQRLAIGERTLYRKIKKFGLDTD